MPENSGQIVVGPLIQKHYTPAVEFGETDGLESAIGQARVAAGDKDIIIIGGASTAQQCLKAGLADELHLDIMPVLLCGGLRLFEDIGTEQIQMERMKVMKSPAGRTHLRFRIVK